MSRPALLLLLLALSCLAFAPAPLPRRPQRWAAGEWELRWYGTSYRVTLGPGGGYFCTDGKGHDWAGTWRTRGTTLHVRERVQGATVPVRTQEWSCDLASPEGRVRMRYVGR